MRKRRSWIVKLEEIQSYQFLCNPWTESNLVIFLIQIPIEKILQSLFIEHSDPISFNSGYDRNMNKKDEMISENQGSSETHWEKDEKDIPSIYIVI
jgi:hypothetical protein